ncbi:MAG: hypothetical protein R2818_02765 [Flavobacteriales bacterium]
MAQGLPRADTPIATVVYTAPDRVEVRFKSGVRFTAENVAAMMKVRAELGMEGKHRVLMLLPELIDFSADLVRVDHYATVPQPNTEAVAWVAHNEGDVAITQVVIGRSKVDFPWKVFMDEAQARAWLEEVRP